MIVVASIKYPLQRKHVRCSLRSTMGTRRATRWLAPSPAAEAAVLVTLLGAHSCCWSATTLAALLSIIRGHARAHAVILRIAPLGGGDRTSGDSRVTYKTNKNHTRTLCALRVCVGVCGVCVRERDATQKRCSPFAGVCDCVGCVAMPGGSDDETSLAMTARGKTITSAPAETT